MDEERILDIIDRMRVSVPEELKQARRVIGEQERLIGEAQAHVREVLEEQACWRRSRPSARACSNWPSVTRPVRAADEYARQVLEELEQRLQADRERTERLA